MSRYRACIDVHLTLRRGEQILLGRRRNTGFADGAWHLPSGHAEDGESATAALTREAAEEIGVTIDQAEVRFVHLMHHHTDSGRIALFFEVTRWDGEPANRESDRCAGWDWFTRTDLPTDMIPYAAQALAHHATGEAYAELGGGRSMTTDRPPRSGLCQLPRRRPGAAGRGLPAGQPRRGGPGGDLLDRRRRSAGRPCPPRRSGCSAAGRAAPPAHAVPSDRPNSRYSPVKEETRRAHRHVHRRPVR